MKILCNHSKKSSSEEQAFHSGKSALHKTLPGVNPGIIALLAALLFISLLFTQSCTVGSPLDATSSSSESELSSSSATDSLEALRTPDSTLEAAFENETNDLQVLVRGTVIRLLSDDTDGDQHQRFILELESGQTLLIAHNIDIGERVPDSMLKQILYVYGEYEWNDEGGVVHWTHTDPDGDHLAGYIYFDGHKYQ